MNPFLAEVTRAALVFVGLLERRAVQFAAAELEREDFVVDLERAAVETDRGVEAGFAVAVQAGGVVARGDAVQVLVLGQRVDVERQPVLGVVHLDGLHRRHESRFPAFRHVALDRTRSAVALQSLNAALRAFGQDEFGSVPRLFDEGVVVVLAAAFVVGQARIGRGVEVVFRLFRVGIDLVREGDRRRCRVQRPFPLFRIVGRAHQGRAVGVVEPYVVGIAVDQRRGGVEQQAGLVAERGHFRGKSQFGLADHVGQQPGGPVVTLGDVLHALVVRRPRSEDLRFGRVDGDELLDQYDRSVVFEQALVVISHEEPRLARVAVGVFLRDCGNFVDVVQQVETVAYAAVDVVVRAAAGAVRGPAAEIGQVGVLLAVEQALARKIVGRAARSGDEVVAGELVGRPVVPDQVGHVGLHVVAVVLGLLLRFPDVLFGGFAFGHHVEVGAGA